MDNSLAFSAPLVLASECVPPTVTPNKRAAATIIARIFREPIAAKVDQAYAHLHGWGLTAVWNISDMANHRQSVSYRRF